MINDYVHSPCIRQCALDDDKICFGCFRTLEEIKRWNTTTSEDRKTIVQNADVRKTTRNLQNRMNQITSRDI